MSVVTTHTAHDEKREATLRANLALAGGHVLQRKEDGTYRIMRWGLARDLDDLDAVERFLVQVQGA
jgi:hypothetical protein